MLRTSSFTSLSTILQSINVADKDKIEESGGNGTNLSNPFASIKSIEADYLTSGSAKRGGGNTKKGVEGVRDFDYLTPAAKKAFNQLRHAFTQAPILQYFDPEQHIWIETDMSGYIIGGVLSQLTSDDLSQLHPVTYYSQKMIWDKTRYKTHDGELLAIVETFKIWRHYLKNCK